MGPERGRGRGRGKGREQGFANEADAQSHAERAAQLLAKARASSSNTTTASSSSSTSSDSKTAASPASTSKDVIALPTLIKSLANPQLGSDAMTIKEAIPIAGKLTRGKLNTPEKLSFLNSLVLGEAGITSEGDIHKILIAFGVRKVGASKSAEKSKGKGALDALSAKVSRKWYLSSAMVRPCPYFLSFASSSSLPPLDLRSGNSWMTMLSRGNMAT
jgi:hypothetical protein